MYSFRIKDVLSCHSCGLMADWKAIAELRCMEFIFGVFNPKRAKSSVNGVLRSFKLMARLITEA